MVSIRIFSVFLTVSLAFSAGVLAVILFNVSSVSANAEPIRVVISGGPAFGKTSILGELELRGETVIRETAIDYIAIQQSKNIPAPWISKNFQVNINYIQQRREESVDPKAKVVFQDRSLIDSIGYCRFRKQGIPAEISEQIENLRVKARYFPYVFFIKPLETHLSKVERFDLDEAAEIDTALREAYLGLGYQIVDILSGPVEERVNQIFAFLKSKNVTVGQRAPIPYLPFE